MIAALIAAAALGGPSLANLSVSDGSTPFAGDRQLLTTVSPNGDGFRDHAIVRFRLNEAATVRMDVMRTNQSGELGSIQLAGGTTVRLPKGPGEVVWAPGRSRGPVGAGFIESPPPSVQDNARRKRVNPRIERRRRATSRHPHRHPP